MNQFPVTVAFAHMRRFCDQSIEVYFNEADLEEGLQDHADRNYEYKILDFDSEEAKRARLIEEEFHRLFVMGEPLTDEQITANMHLMFPRSST